VVSFGGALSSTAAEVVGEHEDRENESSSLVASSMSNMNDVTLNRQGQIPQKGGGSLAGPLINPKELTNEELEYIIRTG
jgi:hypothetical protein